jgi:hypothetical protein
VVIPRFAAPLRSFSWRGRPEAELKFTPEPTQWILSWTEAPAPEALIELEFDEPPERLEDLGPVRPSGDGSLWLPAHRAATEGEKLRYEPQPTKNTLGYWTVVGDAARWRFLVEGPGAFRVAALQGCGAGQGGGEAGVSILRGEAIVAETSFIVVETGHFQNFRWVDVGEIVLDHAGEHELRLAARRIPKAALGDVRAVHLVRQARPPARAN